MTRGARSLRLHLVLPPLIWMAIIFLMSSRSAVPQTPGVSAQIAAIAGHLVVYGVLAVLIARAVAASVGRYAVIAGLSWSISVAYGISDEFHQSLVPGRYPSIEDVLTDMAGAAIGLALYYLFLRRQAESRALI